MANVIDLTEDGEMGNSAPINLHSDTEDEDLQRAISLSLQDQDIPLNVAATVSPTETTVTDSTPTHGLLGIDRKAMEAERLARLKRKSEMSNMGSQSVVTKTGDISPPPLSKRPKLSKPEGPKIFSPTTVVTSTPTPFHFPKPRILLTSQPSRHTASKLTAISFRDIISVPFPDLSLKSVLLSSFVADFDWLLPHFNTRTTSFVLVLHAQNHQHKQLLKQDFDAVPNVRLVIPKCMGGSGNMHSKVILLFFKSQASSTNEEVCRIVIPSANLTPADWGVGSVMENVLSVVDLPKRPTGKDQQQSRFCNELKRHLQAMEVPDYVIQKLDLFDFSATQNVRFVQSASQSLPLTDPQTAISVPSKAQDHQVDEARVGLLSLNDAVLSLGLSILPTDAAYPPRLDFVTSSLGNLGDGFVKQLYRASCGDLNLSSIATPARKTPQKGAPIDDDQSLMELIKQKLRIYFPSDRTVQRSKGGPASGGTICFQKKWWEANELVRECLHDCVGSRGDGILMHSKILYVRFNSPKTVVDSDGRSQIYVGWAYIGSANLSESAWGRIVFDAKLKQSKFTCRNWESGLIVPIAYDNDTSYPTDSNVRNSGETIESDSLKQQAAQKEQDMDGHHHRRQKGVLEPSHAAFFRRTMPKQVNADHHLNSAQIGTQSLSDLFSPPVPVPMQNDNVRKHLTEGTVPWFFRGEN